MSDDYLPKYYEKTLDNGLKIVAIPLNNGTNVVSTDIFYSVGSRDETMGKSGMAHMLEHLSFKSTKKLKAGEFDKIVKNFGAVNNASTSFDSTHYYIKSTSSNAKKSLELFAELMDNLQLKDKEFQTERDVVIQERLWRTDNSPIGYLYFKLFNNAFTYHPYHWTPIGFMKDIENWDIKDIRKFYKKHYQPQNAVIVVAGDIDKDTVFKYAKKYFNSKKNSTKKLKKIHTIEPKQDTQKRIIITKESQVEILAIGYHIPNSQHKDQVALSMISQILSSGASSRLYKTLVDEKNLVSSVYGYNMEQKDPSLFLFIATCNDAVNALDVEKILLEEIQKIKNGDVKKSELEKIKINTKADFIFSLESSSSVSSLYGEYFINGDIKQLYSYQKDLENLTLNDIITVAKKYFKNENSITAILKRQTKEKND